MTAPQPNDAPPSSDPNPGQRVCAESSPKTEAEAAATGAQAVVKKLTPEEQMALYESDLKENDWGHQPC